MARGHHRGWGSYGDVFPFGGEGPRDRSESQKATNGDLDEGDDCPECGSDLVIRSNSSTGEDFLGCSEYRNGCRFTSNLG